MLRKNDHAIDRIIASINEYGFTVPLLVSADGEIIDGHLRLKAAQKLGFTEVRYRAACRRIVGNLRLWHTLQMLRSVCPELLLVFNKTLLGDLVPAVCIFPKITMTI
jgi:hypothetical protein